MFSNKVFNSILLIAGTTVGAGILAIPSFTAISGTLPGTLLNILCWLFMLLTGFLYVEVCLWMPKHAHILSMSQRFLGKYGKLIGGFLFLFLYYCLMTAYTSQLAPFLIPIFSSFISKKILYISVALIFSLIIFLGTTLIHRINFILMLGLILSFILMIVSLINEVKIDNLIFQNWSYFLLPAPVLFGAFGYHNIIPTIAVSLDYNPKKLRYAILIGTLIPLTAYLLWQFVILGSVPSDTLITEAKQGNLITNTVTGCIENICLYYAAPVFSFFAIVTSLLGVSISMLDFINDALKIPRSGIYRMCTSLLVLFPPTILSMTDPSLFFIAFAIAGGLGEALLNGLFPILMVWRGKYSFSLNTYSTFLGQKKILTILLLLTFLVIGIELYDLLYSGH